MWQMDQTRSRNTTLTNKSASGYQLKAAKVAQCEIFRKQLEDMILEINTWSIPLQMKTSEKRMGQKQDEK